MNTGLGEYSDTLQDPPYLEHFGLKRDPFSLAIDNEFFYEDPVRNQNLDLLHHVTLSTDLLMLVTGVHGSGKTSLLHRFISKANETWQICLINANSTMFEEQLLRQVFRGFGQPTPAEGGVKEHLQILGEYLDNLQRQGETALLIVDDAHELPAPALQFIARMNTLANDKGKLLRIFLFAESQIEATLASPAAAQVKQSITHTLELPPLSEKDTAEYIKQRMMVAGFNSDAPSVFAYPFSDGVVSKIFKSSHGLPTQINKHAGQILVEMTRKGSKENLAEPVSKPAKEKKSSVRKLPALSVIAAILVAAVLIATLAVQDTINELFSSPSSPEQTATTQDTPSADANKPGQIQRIKREPIVAKTETPETIAPSDTHGTTQDEQQEITIAETVEQSPSVAASESDMLDKTLADKDTDESKPLEQTKPEDITVSETTKTAQAKTTTAIKGETRPAETMDQPQQPTPVLSQTAEASKPPVKKTGPQIKETAPKPEPAPVEENKQHAWLYAQNPWHYTLQLLSTRNPGTIDKFVAANKLGDNAIVLKSRRKTRDWYVLLYGSYPDKKIATKTSAQLARKFSTIKPWVRSIASLQTKYLGGKTTTLGKTAGAPKPSAPVTSQTKQAPSAKKTPARTSPEEWLLAQSPWSYTIQLLGSKNRQSIINYVKQHKLDKSKAIYIHTKRDHQDWYILIYGAYPTRQDAKNAIDKLPPALRKSSPWLRPVASLHAATISAGPVSPSASP